MSLAFVGRIVQSLKGFYNGINPATLTGAIDVVIVKQPDGTYHSSPFHVRFGKLGVLRSREKVVDIEINGESISLHMKLGEAGEAFFVQEIESEEGEQDEDLGYLATSPLPSSDSLMAEGVKELHRQEQEVGEPHFKRGSLSSSSATSSPRGQPINMGGPPTASVEVSGKPRRKVLKKKKQHHHHQKSSAARAGIRSVSMPESVAEEVAMFDFDESTSDESVGSNYDEHSITVIPGDTLTSPPLRHFASLHSSSSPDVKVLDVDLSRESEFKGLQLQGTTSHRRMSSFGNSSFIATPFSDPETSPIGSPQVSRPSTPKSDTEVDKQHVEDSQTSALMENSATWAWGMFPTNLEAAMPQQKSESEPTQVKVQVVQDGSTKEDSDSSAKNAGGFMSIWNKSSPVPSQAGAGVPKPEALQDIYLDDLTNMDDPEMARIYLGQPSREKEEDTESGRGQSLPQSPNSVEGAIGGPVSFTMSEVRHLGPVALSLCGGLGDPESLTLDKFMQKVVTFEDLAVNPNITSNPDLVVKIHDKFYNWTTAGPMVLSQIVFHKQLPDPAVKDLEKEHMPKKKKKKGWFSWGRSAEAAEEGADASTAVTGSASSTTLTETASQEGDVQSSPIESPSSTPPHSNRGTPRKHRPQRAPREETTTSTETDTDMSEKEASSPPQCAVDITETSTTVSIAETSTTANITDTDTTVNVAEIAATTTADVTNTETTPTISDTEAATTTVNIADITTTSVNTTTTVDTTETTTTTTTTTATPTTAPSTAITIEQDERVQGSESSHFLDEELDLCQDRRRRHSSHSSQGGGAKREKFIKSLRLSSQQISKMGLREGHNEIVFSVTTQYQGTTRCVSSIYLWNHDDKIVISDIDGTITKSDVLGQIMPIIGRDWSQSGVAQLFTRINENGYKLIYLSARAIGQSRSTKDMLKSIRQGGLILPNGPLFLNPTSLFSAFHREVILKNPEEFKISCLKDIADLFPSSPFVAGFGNKLNDVIAYRALDIPKSRIFTINPQGQLRHDMSLTFQSSYTGMSDLVDHLFPARDYVDRGTASEFTGVSYWRQPIPDLSDTELALLCGGATVSAVTPAPVADTTLEVQIEAPKQ